VLLAGCGGPQSALDPAGPAAERIAGLFWWMAAGGALVWVAVVGLGVYAIRAQPAALDRRRQALLIIGGGAAVPTLVLGVLLARGLSMLPGLVAPAPEASLRIAVTGEQWWWRIRYLPAGGEPVELANEIRLPVGEPVEFLLESADVIHSFWIPSLGGKVDMIPGRRTRLSLRATRTGVFRGVCAEYCGTAHARMAFPVVVVDRAEFSRWLAHQAKPAPTPGDPLGRRGQDLFLANGCGACHAVRGTAAEGVIGPDLTHVGGRLGLGADTLPGRRDHFRRWIARPESVKPGVLMPAFAMLPPEELDPLAAYLDGLE
jgi:cytochrome c oxidase subunit 2